MPAEALAEETAFVHGAAGGVETEGIGGAAGLALDAPGPVWEGGIGGRGRRCAVERWHGESAEEATWILDAVGGGGFVVAGVVD